MTNPVQEVQRLGQSIWYDNIRRGLIKSRELQKLIDLGVSGLTSNPTIFERAIAGSTDYDDALLSLAVEAKDAGEIFEALALDDIRAAADILRPIYERTSDAGGFASLEVSPYLSHDTEGTIAEARRLFAALSRPNVMVKVPATPECIPAIRRLIGEGINVNVTLIFSLDAYLGVRDAYIGGLEDLAGSGGDVSTIASVASFFVSRVDSAVATSPSIGSFGLWAEQLTAESLGKEGKGIVPIAGEPPMAPESYGDDRLFVYLRVEDDDNADTDASFERIESSGRPVVRLELRDLYDLGAEFFRWEFATAVAGANLGVQPFDQPNVQAAKDMTESVLKSFEESGKLPQVEAIASLEKLVSEVKPGDYLAIMAYVHQTPELDNALYELRQKVTERHQIATTLGYGPRFLHSTGQLHKGGPESGLFLQLTADHGRDVIIPGEPYTFGALVEAQALGDLQALHASGRRVARVRLGSEDSAATQVGRGTRELERKPGFDRNTSVMSSIERGLF